MVSFRYLTLFDKLSTLVFLRTKFRKKKCYFRLINALKSEIIIMVFSYKIS